MSTKIKALVIFFLITSVTLPVYYIYRSEYVEKDYIQKLTDKSTIMKSLSERLNREQSPDSNKLTKLFNDIIARDRTIAAIAVTDKMERLRFMVKNDAVLNSGRIVDELVKDIREKRFNSSSGNTPFIRNYNGSDLLRDRLYIFSFTSSGQSTLAVYSFVPDRMTMIRIALEVILVLSGSFMFTAALIMLMRKQGIINDIDTGNIRTIVIGEKSTKQEKEKQSAKKVKPAPEVKKRSKQSKKKSALQIDENELQALPEITENECARKMPASDNAESLNSKIFTLFKKIHKNMSPESVSLYMKRMEGKLSKTYELKGKSFLGIDSLSFDSIKLSDIEKINKPGTHITDDGKTIRVPLIDGGSLIGLIEIRLRDNSSNPDISTVQTDIKNIAKDINNFIITNNVIKDRETGFFSRTYLEARLGESISSALNGKDEFTLLLINIFSGVDTDRKQRDTILKVLHPVLLKITGEKHDIFLSNDSISVIIPGAGKRESEKLKSAMSGEISRFRIKISDDNIVKLNPQSILINSADSEDVRNILSEAESLVSALN